MPASHTIELHFPLPAYLSPDLVVQHLQTYEPLIIPHPYLLRYNRRPVDEKDVIADPFFTEDGANIECYEVIERVVIIPLLGLSKDIKIPATFQSFPAGVRCRADAQGGVRVWSTYEVQRRDLGAEFERAGRADSDGVARDDLHDIVDGAGLSSPGAGEWELVEYARVECNAIVKPFVVKSFEAAHRDLCQKVIDGLKRTTSKEHLSQAQRTPVVVPASGVMA
ncbi:hypothetical protein N8I77_000846 [Diaporthe amygdali]|uniref:DUF7053 domain-containing protein n=1 Tax=Phomopsis amygdali TaxID=1214568 RepID=A0AAD9W9G8_PHOAM|nr:uncharacterized protein J7T55_012767 [Diaporthe amygdali]KAJ0115487.1 hypothetical protein J7T55_012767 [Diaporthe amygdali]KAK2613981.1 hypothetical protein N8I77_000846 [Diaporthe amygdali]